MACIIWSKVSNEAVASHCGVCAGVAAATSPVRPRWHPVTRAVRILHVDGVEPDEGNPCCAPVSSSQDRTSLRHTMGFVQYKGFSHDQVTAGVVAVQIWCFFLDGSRE